MQFLQLVAFEKRVYFEPKPCCAHATEAEQSPPPQPVPGIKVCSGSGGCTKLKPASTARTHARRSPSSLTSAALMISPARNTVAPLTISCPTGRTLCAVRTPLKMRTDFSAALNIVESSPSTAAVSSTFVWRGSREFERQAGRRVQQGGDEIKGRIWSKRAQRPRCLTACHSRRLSDEKRKNHVHKTSGGTL